VQVLINVLIFANLIILSTDQYPAMSDDSALGLCMVNIDSSDYPDAAAGGVPD
jgi:hypothetical protein